MRAVSTPRRVWSARTPTWVTAAVSSTAPPGTAIRQGNDVVVPTIAVPTDVGPACTPQVRPGS